MAYPIPFEQILVTAAVLFLVSVIAGKMSYKLGIPALLLFIFIGMLAGSEGPGGIYWDNPELVQSVGIVALAFILFSGGLDTPWDRVKPVLGASIALSSVGVLLTAAAVSVFSCYVLGFSILEGMLLGAIISSTDAAAVFSVLRSKSVHLEQRLESTLELESGSNDPMAVFLTAAAIHYLLNPTEPGWSLAPMLIQQMGVGFLAGVFIGRLMVFFMNRLKLESEGLYPVVTIATVLLSFGFAELLNGNGFLSVYVTGIVMGNRKFVQRIRLSRFHDAIAWIMQIVMFLILGLQVFPSKLAEVALAGFALSLFLMFIARPAAVYLVLAFTRFDMRQRTFIGWVGLRGAVPIILATYPLVAGLPDADYIFNLVFFVVLTSVLVQGTSIPLVARLLKVRRLEGLDYSGLSPTSISDNTIEVTLPQGAVNAGRQLLEIGIPDKAKVLLVRKGTDVLESRGSLVLEEGDRLLIFGERQILAQARHVLEQVSD